MQLTVVVTVIAMHVITLRASERAKPRSIFGPVRPCVRIITEKLLSRNLCNLRPRSD